MASAVLSRRIILIDHATQAPLRFGQKTLMADSDHTSHHSRLAHMPLFVVGIGYFCGAPT